MPPPARARLRVVPAAAPVHPVSARATMAGSRRRPRVARTVLANRGQGLGRATAAMACPRDQPRTADTA
eukprot:802665-Alexandrium_andersonii.AAC.1